VCGHDESSDRAVSEGKKGLGEDGRILWRVTRLREDAQVNGGRWPIAAVPAWTANRAHLPYKGIYRSSCRQSAYKQSQ